MQIVSEKERKIKMDKKEFALNQHEKWNGKIEVISRAKIETPEDLAVAYTPGVAEPCLKIAKDVDLSYKYTRRGNLVAVVTEQVCRLWKESVLCLKNLAMWMLFHFAFAAKM